MWSRTKRLIILPLLVALLLAGGTGGVVLADNGTDNGPRVTFLDMVAEYLSDIAEEEITTEELQEAFSDARDYMQDLAPEDRDRESFKALVAEYLSDITKEEITTENLEEAINYARDQMKARASELKERFQARWHERAKWQEQCEVRLERLRDRLGDRWENIRERLEARRAEWREVFAERQEFRQGLRMPRRFGPGNGPDD